MVRPYLKERGLSKEIKSTICFIETRKRNVRRRKFKIIDDKNDPIKTSTASRFLEEGIYFISRTFYPESMSGYTSLYLWKRK